MTTIDDKLWMAYVDGELDDADRHRVEAAMATNPELAERVQVHLRLRGRLRQGLAAELDEPVPDRLSRLLTSPPQLTGASSAGPVLVAPPTKPSVSRAWLFAIAGLAAGLLLPRLATQGGADLRLHGPLAQALEGRLTAEPPDATGWKMALSFKDQQGRYCRGFRGEDLAGLACKGDDGQWQLAMLVLDATPGGEMRQAASSLPTVILEAIDARLAGQTLDAAAEAKAREAGWR